MSETSDANLRFVDLFSDEAAPELRSQGIHWGDAFKRIHAVNRSGTIVSGIDAFLVIWAELPVFSGLSSIFKAFPGLRDAGEIVYVWWAARRPRLANGKGSPPDGDSDRNENAKP